MLDILKQLADWADSGKHFAVARVISTWGSAPRKIGATMIIDEDMHFVGSVSGGCIEGAVIEESIRVLRSREPRLLEFGVDDGTAWGVGLACGGTVRLIVEAFPGAADPRRQIWDELISAAQAGTPAVLVTELDPVPVTRLLLTGGTTVSHGSEIAPLAAIELAAREALASRRSLETSLAMRNLFFHVLAPRPRLLVVGANHIATELVRLARAVGFETIVVDPRATFAATDRFDLQPDRLIVEWPQDAFDDIVLDSDTFAALVTHDPKIDDPATELLLRSDVAYIGALGSRRTQVKRRKRLLAAGFVDDEIGRIYGPIGLDIGAESPQEIALSILAQVVKVRNTAREAAPKV